MAYFALSRNGEESINKFLSPEKDPNLDHLRGLRCYFLKMEARLSGGGSPKSSNKPVQQNRFLILPFRNGHARSTYAMGSHNLDLVLLTSQTPIAFAVLSDILKRVKESKKIDHDC